ncbi:MAG: 2-iminoacetate synthase ThiH [Candidatus Schekmanbacteria bacterium]|nr:2-iminoacetate synthase ThiH [Candidatus Schekmanbacteria bacterium]
MIHAAGEGDVERALSVDQLDLLDFAALLSRAAALRLEDLARRARQISLLRWGRSVQLFAPLYVSNECTQVCTYCAFQRRSSIPRRTLAVDEVVAEARMLLETGFRHILLVSGEHPKLVPLSYLETVVAALHPEVPALSIEVAPQSLEGYERLVHAGTEGLVVYQETYDRDVYARVHLSGRKANYDWRLAAPERGAAAGMRRVGLGALLGLADWATDVLALGVHARYLMRHWWRTFVTVSLPRLRYAKDAIAAPRPVSDAEMTQAICALRLFLPDTGIVLSTRESPRFRHGVIPLGVTHASAGSRTEPGGYSTPAPESEQFRIDDDRPAELFAAALRGQGYDAVWKDWEAILHG